MSPTAILINALAAAALLVALIADLSKTLPALKIAARTLVGMMPMVLIIIILIGLLLGFVPHEFIGRVVGGESGFAGVLIAAVVGAILFIPSLIAFPLAASLIESGAALSAVAAFISSLTMIGVVSLPLEIKELGVKITALRNGMGFLFALLIGLIMGAVL